MKTNRRTAFKKMGAAILGAFGLTTLAQAKAQPHNPLPDEAQQDVPLFSGGRVHGDLVFVAGKGAHFEGDIKQHTDHVLKELEKELIKQGSSMEHVLKVNVYLHDLNDYHGMNEIYRGRFGKKPPVRTTVATYGGVPGDSLVEIDCIATLAK
jgi:2-iminobutanoate/2-iminopropanoate deaminase